jgi:membrane dipeptidase
MSSDSLHQSALVIDSHNDSIVAHIRRNLSMAGSTEPAGHAGTVSYLREYIDNSNVQLNFSKMKQGGLDAAFFAVDVTRAWHNHLAYAMDAFGFFHQEVKANPDAILIARCAADITEAKNAGKLAAILVIENSEGIDRSLNTLHSLYEIGVRSIGITHNLNTWASTGNAEEHRNSGLTNFGVDLVKEMNALGMLVDVSHISERGFYDVLEIAERPIIASHSNCRALWDHPRNLRDDQIKAIAANAGVIGVTFVRDFVDDQDPTFEKLIDHIDHIIQLVGPDHAGIGSDFDGGGDLVSDTTDFPTITEALQQRGHDDEVIRKILGQNHLRVFQAACG